MTVPDLAGCFSAGDSLDDALESAKEAIALHLEGLLDEGQDIPNDAPIHQHQNNPDYAGGVWAIVEVDSPVFEGEAEHIDVALPKALLKRIDDYAQAKQLTRSVFLAEAAMR